MEPIPGDYSMVCFGAVLVMVREGLDKTFYGRLRPILDKWIPEPLTVCGFSREDTLSFDNPKTVTESFAPRLLALHRRQPVRMISSDLRVPGINAFVSSGSNSDKA